MSKFKVGDEIIIKDEVDEYNSIHGDYKAGDRGIIVDVAKAETNFGEGCATVDFRDGRRDSHIVYKTEMELDLIALTPLYQALKEL